MRKKVLCLSVLTSMLALNVNAQEKEQETIKLDEVVVSDSKFKLKKENSGKVIHKITTETIEKNSGKTVVDLINSVAGIEINGNTSSPGQNLGIFVRGGVTKEVVVLIDGVQVGNPAVISGGFDLRLLDLNDVESIEIVKGAASTLYGTGAVTAVINITLKQAKSGKANAALSLFGGTNNNQETRNGTVIQSAANVNGKIKDFDYLVNFSSFDARGVSAVKSEKGEAFNDDPFQRIATNIKLGYKFNDKFSVSTLGSYSEFNNSYDDGAFVDGDNHSLDKNYRIGFSPKYDYRGGSIQVNAAYSKFETDRTKTKYPSTNKAESYIVDAFVKHQFDKLYLVAGVNYQDNQISEAYSIPFGKTDLSRVNYEETPKSRLIDPYVNAVYVSDFGLNVNAGLRLNNHNKYGNHLVYNLNPSYRFKQENGYIKVLGSYSTAFLAPSVQELYSVWGNIDLKPQESTTYEGGLEYKLNSLVLNTVYFYRDVENIIDYNFATNKMDNFGSTTIQGVEFNVAYKVLENVSLNANYTFTENDKIAVRIPKHKVNAGVNYTLKATNFSLDYQYLSDRLDTSNLALEAYSLLNFSANHSLNKNVKLFLAATNIFNEDYQERIGYSTLGRNYKLGVRFNF
ncbi:TonB-dependent receptor plug domain-containing protein [Tenacibaculum sp. 190524A02b]|uniref:TonB-dependent receptor plug domain-containing protein n=1 Tax=Tenacibaculum vairaonense TaxID=3137860 RepID=UPI0031FAC0C4